MSEDETSSTQSTEPQPASPPSPPIYGNDPFDKMMWQLDSVKQKLTDNEYLELINSLTAARKRDRGVLEKNKVLILELFRIVAKACMGVETEVFGRHNHRLRPFEAVNVMVSFVNIIENLEKMSEDESDFTLGKLTFVVDQLGTNFSTDHYAGVSAYRSPIQLLDYNQLQKVMNILSKLSF